MTASKSFQVHLCALELLYLLSAFLENVKGLLNVDSVVEILIADMAEVVKNGIIYRLLFGEKQIMYQVINIIFLWD